MDTEERIQLRRRQEAGSSWACPTHLPPHAGPAFPPGLVVIATASGSVSALDGLGPGLCKLGTPGLGTSSRDLLHPEILESGTSVSRTSALQEAMPGRPVHLGHGASIPHIPHLSLSVVSQRLLHLQAPVQPTGNATATSYMILSFLVLSCLYPRAINPSTQMLAMIRFNAGPCPVHSPHQTAKAGRRSSLSKALKALEIWLPRIYKCAQRHKL